MENTSSSAGCFGAMNKIKSGERDVALYEVCRLVVSWMDGDGGGFLGGGEACHQKWREESVAILAICDLLPFTADQKIKNIIY